MTFDTEAVKQPEIEKKYEMTIWLHLMMLFSNRWASVCSFLAATVQHRRLSGGLKEFSPSCVMSVGVSVAS